MITLGTELEKKRRAEAAQAEADERRRKLVEELHRMAEAARQEEEERLRALEEDRERAERLAEQRKRDEERLAEAQTEADAERERNALLIIELRTIAERERLKEVMKKDAEALEESLQVTPKPDDSGTEAERCTEDTEALKKKTEAEEEAKKNAEAEEEAQKNTEEEKARADERRRFELQQLEAEEEGRKKTEEAERLRLYQELYNSRE